MNNPNVAFVSKVNGLQVQFYYNPVHNDYTAIWGNRYHDGFGFLLRKDENGDWREANSKLDKNTESILDSQIKKFEEAKKANK